MSEANIVLPALTSAQVAILWFILGSAVIGLLYGGILVRTVLAANPGPKSMTDVSDAVEVGAMAYLKRQVSTMSIFVVIIFIALFLMYRNVYHDMWLSAGISVAFLLGVGASYLAGFIGMWLAVKANVRSANAALTSFKDAMELAFKAGGVSGMATVGLGLLGATIIFLVYQQDAMKVLVGFGFGGSLAALFMRVGGGIYTKAADVGGDLVGKVEAGIPEDDPRNAATIADNVGDNVGDCAGMAADLFESYEITIISSLILGYSAFRTIGHNPTAAVLYPLIVPAIGIFASVIGIFMIRATPRDRTAMSAINRGFWLSALLTVIGAFLVAQYYVHDLKVFYAVLTGVILSLVASQITE